jgi:Ca-activated chloride channel family protein
MSFLWPGFLFLLGAIPLLVAIYAWMLRRRKRFSVRYSSLSLVREALSQQTRWRRYIPFALFLLALASLVIAVSRPVSIVSIPTDQTTIVLAMDVSWSMCTTDIKPNRLAAAEAAALDFIRRQKASTQIGVVAFSGFAELVQAPTTDPELLQSAIESLMTARRTAIGSAILKSLDAIAEIDPNVAPPLYGRDSDPPAPAPVPKGAYVPDIIILLTDGINNTGPQPVDAAQQAVDRGVRVYTIGFGTADESSFPVCPPQLLGSEPDNNYPSAQQYYGYGQYGGGGGFRRAIDEETLQEVADKTGGEYYSATSASQLQDVFRGLPTYLIMRHEVMEISVAFAAIGALLAALAIILSMLWQPL